MDEERYRCAERALWAHWGAEPREHVVSVRGAGVRLQEVGDPDGPTVLFVHGAAIAGSSWADLASRLPSLRCLLLDRPGCGLSEPLPSRPAISQLPELADDLLAEVLDQLSVDRVVVVSTSMGGLYALRTAAAHPERVEAIVHFGWSLGAPPVDRLPSVMRMAGLPGIGWLMARVPVTERSVAAMLRTVGLARAIDDGHVPDVALAWSAAVQNHTDTRIHEYALAGSDLVHQMATLELPAELLARVEAPVRIVFGTEDPFSTVATMRSLTDALPDGRMEVWDGAGHAAWIEDLDRAAEVVRSTTTR